MNNGSRNNQEESKKEEHKARAQSEVTGTYGDDDDDVTPPPHLMAILNIEQAVEQQSECQQVGKTIIVEHKEEKKKQVKKAKKQKAATTTTTTTDLDADEAFSESESSSDDEESGNNNMTTVSLANDSQATEVTSNIHSAREMYGKVVSNATAISRADKPTVSTDVVQADGTDQSVYDYVVHAYKTAKDDEKVSFVDLYWEETEKRNREEERVAALQDPEAPEEPSVNSADKAQNAKTKIPKTKLVCCLQIYVALLFLGCVVAGTLCGGLGMCHKPEFLNGSSQEEAASTTTNTPEVDDTPLPQKPFYSRQELINAVDQYLLDPGMVPAVYGVEGIAQWDVSQVTVSLLRGDSVFV